jgi:glycosyltransferase involved in cell wall biosynthesis
MLAPFGIRPKGTLSARMLPLAQALTGRQHRVHILAPPVHNPQDAGRRDVYAGVTVTHTARPSLSALPHVVQHVWALFQAVLADNPDIVHLFKPKGYSGLAALLVRLTRPTLPLVVDTDDWEGWGGWNNLLPYPRPAKTLFAWQERHLPRHAHAVTVASRTLETQVWGFGVAPNQVFYLPNGITVDPARQPPQPSAFAESSATMLLYTRFWEFDVRDIVAVLAAIVQQRPDARLLVVGQGEQQEEYTLLSLAQRAGVRAAIDYRGWVEPAAIPALLASADIALVPMDDTLINRARCSAKLLEIMAAGVPVVAARVGQVGEYITHGQSGLLVPAGNPAALARAALELLNNAALRQRLSVGGRQALASFSWDVLAPQAERAYQRAQQSCPGLPYGVRDEKYQKT